MAVATAVALAVAVALASSGVMACITGQQYVALQGSITRRHLPRQLALVAPPPFPIDMVVTWVNGTDPAWQRRRDAVWQAVSNPSAADNTAERYMPGGTCAPDAELTVCLRSAATFAPWLRTIWVVVDDGQTTLPRPHAEYYCGDGQPTLRTVPHSVIFRACGIPPAIALPTFNSHAIEACLWAIPGLAQQFLYANDDCYFANDVLPGDFFDVTGAPVNTFTVRHRWHGSVHGAAWHKFARVCKPHVRPAVATIDVVPYFITPSHTTVALTVQQCAAASRLPFLADHWRTTALTRFRSPTDIPPLGATCVLGLAGALGAAWCRPPWSAVRVTQTCVAEEVAVAPHLTWTCASDRPLADVLQALQTFITNQRRRVTPLHEGLVLVVAAHPDDEMLFGFVDVLTARAVHVVVVTHVDTVQRHHELDRACAAARQWRARAWDAPPASLTWSQLGLRDGKRVTWTPQQVATLVQHLHAIATAAPVTAVVTHDAVGEYGHRQHKQVHAVTHTWARAAGLPVHTFAERTAACASPPLRAARDCVVRGAYWRQRVGKYR